MIIFQSNTHIVKAAGVGVGLILEEIAANGAELQRLALGLSPVSKSRRRKGQSKSRDNGRLHLERSPMAQKE